MAGRKRSKGLDYRVGMGDGVSAMRRAARGDAEVPERKGRHTISGATWTREAYIRSLKSAVKAAKKAKALG